jgi:hypothetical protein
MRARLILGAAGMIAALLLIATMFSRGLGADGTEDIFSQKGQEATEQAGRPSQAAQAEQMDQRLRAQIQAQLEWLDLQKKHLEEQAQEQIQQFEEDAKRQIAQVRQQARRQMELLDAQKRLYLAQAEGQLAQLRLSPAAPVDQPGRKGASPKAGPPRKGGAQPISEKLDTLLDRLEGVEKRLQRLEEETKGRRGKK